MIYRVGAGIQLGAKANRSVSNWTARSLFEVEDQKTLLFPCSIHDKLRKTHYPVFSVSVLWFLIGRLSLI